MIFRKKKKNFTTLYYRKWVKRLFKAIKNDVYNKWLIHNLNYQWQASIHFNDQWWVSMTSYFKGTLNGFSNKINLPCSPSNLFFLLQIQQKKIINKIFKIINLSFNFYYVSPVQKIFHVRFFFLLDQTKSKKQLFWIFYPFYKIFSEPDNMRYYIPWLD